MQRVTVPGIGSIDSANGIWISEIENSKCDVGQGAGHSCLPYWSAGGGKELLEPLSPPWSVVPRSDRGKDGLFALEHQRLNKIK